ncbi:MAG: acetyltransferase [Limisphaerales bacterium]
MKPKYVIIGAGGHAKSVADVILSTGSTVSFFEDSKKAGQSIFGIPIISSLAEISTLNSHFLAVGIGDNYVREKVTEEYSAKYPDLRLEPIIHSTAYVSPFSVVQIGSVVMAHATVGPKTMVGKGCIINTKASIDHDSQMSDFSSLGPGVVTGGNTKVGNRSAVCIGATIKHGISIGSDCVIGAMSYLNKDLSDQQTAYGVPAKVVRKHAVGEPYL